MDTFRQIHRRFGPVGRSGDPGLLFSVDQEAERRELRIGVGGWVMNSTAGGLNKGIPYYAKGSRTRTRAALKSRTLRVTTVRSCSSAVAAIIPSRIGIAFPLCRRSETNRAHRQMSQPFEVGLGDPAPVGRASGVASPTSSWGAAWAMPRGQAKCGSNGHRAQSRKSFNVRGLDREPAAVLDACDREGAVRIRRRNGRTFTLRPEVGPDRITALPGFRARMMRILAKQIAAC